MKRTIASARQALEEDFAPTLSDYQMRQARAVLDAAEQHARNYADGFLDRTVPEVERVVVEATEELTTVRDELDALRASASDGRIPANDYASRLAELRDRQTRAEIAVEAAEDRVAEVETIEADPVGYDAQSERFQHLRRAFPW